MSNNMIIQIRNIYIYIYKEGKSGTKNVRRCVKNTKGYI